MQGLFGLAGTHPDSLVQQTVGDSKSHVQLVVSPQGQLLSVSSIPLPATPIPFVYGSLSGIPNSPAQPPNAKNLSVGNSISITGGTGTGATLQSVIIDTIQDIRTTATPQFLRLGIGVAADPNTELLVKSAGAIQTAIRIQNTTAAGGEAILELAAANYSLAGLAGISFIDINTASQAIIFDDSTGLNIQTQASTPIFLRTNATTRVTLDATSGLITVTGKITGLTQATATTDAVAGGRTISTTSPLTGGGNLTADRTFAITAANLVGTTNQVSLSAPGTGVLLGSTNITLSTPQDIATTSTPQFSRMGLGIAADTNFALKIDKGASPTYSQFVVRANGAGGFSILSFAADNNAIGWDTDYSASNWTARHTSAFSITKDTGSLRIRGNGGLVSGNTYTPTDILSIYNAGSIAIGTAALATNATDGFFFISSSAGAPTGVPTAHTGRVALHYDSTNNQIYINNAGTWKKTAALT